MLKSPRSLSVYTNMGDYILKTVHLGQLKGMQLKLIKRRYVKGVPFLNRRYKKGAPFLSRNGI